MDRNEYRRSLIMLRSLVNGYSGHARIEIRTLTGILSILASLPQDAQNVQAALVGSRRGEYYAAPLGALRRDLRGQAGLSVNFDPRRIGGRPLEAYSLLVIVNTENNACQMVLSGNLAGSREIDWSKTRDAVCTLYAPAQDDGAYLPAPEPPAEPAPIQPRENAASEADAADEAADDGGCILCEVDDAPPEASESESPQPTPIDANTEENAEDAPREQAPDPSPRPFTRQGWKFTRVNLPSGCGFSHAYVGVPESSGASSEICCAIPGTYAPEPPIGLDDYEWSGGAGDGWWIKCYITH